MVLMKKNVKIEIKRINVHALNEPIRNTNTSDCVLITIFEKQLILSAGFQHVT